VNVMKSRNLYLHGRLRTKCRNSYAKSLEFPKRWRAILGGFLLLLVIRVIGSDPVGNLRVPPVRECFVGAPVVLGACFLFYIDWKEKAGRH
jgi:hypothetical protein